VRTTRRNLLTFGFLALLLAAGWFLFPSLQNEVEATRARAQANRTDGDMAARNQNAFAMILGEVRATAADLMFVKTDRYLHSGVAYVPHLKLDSVNEDKHLAGCEHGHTDTLIRTTEEDFRGFLGAIERQVKPYRDPSLPHVHGAEEEILPWFRLMTLSNPHYIRGYRVGGLTLARQGKWQEALDFMREGIRKNTGHPELFLLYQSLAAFHLQGRTRTGYPWGDAWLADTLKAARKAFDLGLKQRPELGETGKRKKDLVWTDDLEEDFCFSAHIIPLLLREEGRLDEALAAARRMHSLAPDYLPIERTMNELAPKSPQP